MQIGHLYLAAMKRIISILFTLCICSLNLLAQIKTQNSRDDIAINGIKFGYIYTYDQIKKALGEPTRIYTWEATDFGQGHEFLFENDLTVRMNDDPRENDPGIITFIIKSPKYTLDIKGKKLKVGDPLEKVKELPGFTSMQEILGVYTIYFNNMMTDESIRIISSKDGLIECINIEPRYY